MPPKPKLKDRVVIPIVLTAELKRNLEYIALREKKSISQIAREALQQYIQEANMRLGMSMALGENDDPHLDPLVQEDLHDFEIKLEKLEKRLTDLEREAQKDARVMQVAGAYGTPIISNSVYNGLKSVFSQWLKLRNWAARLPLDKDKVNRLVEIRRRLRRLEETFNLSF